MIKTWDQSNTVLIMDMDPSGGGTSARSLHSFNRLSSKQLQCVYNGVTRVCAQPVNMGCWVRKSIENLTHCPNPTAKSPKITWFVSLPNYPPCLPFFSPSALRRWRFANWCLNCDYCIYNNGSNEVAGKWVSSCRMHNNVDKSSPVSWRKKRTDWEKTGGKKHDK